MKLQKSNLKRKAKFVSTVMGISLLSVPMLSDITNAQSPSLAPQTGLQFQASEEFNVGAVTTLSVTTTYQVDSGKCVGQFYYPNTETHSRTHEELVFGRAAFISPTTPPAPGLRVTIRNVTAGLDRNPSPYTDRGYDKAPMSQGFKVSFDITHKGSYLAVQPGNNDFSYEIKRGNTIIESGTFTARIDRRNQSITRNDFLNWNIGFTDNTNRCQQQPASQQNGFPMPPLDWPNNIPRDWLRDIRP